jgi:hypothetical protein
MIVVSAAPAAAQALAALAGCPVVLVPTAGPARRPFPEGPIVCVVNPASDSGHAASTATRLALDLGRTLRLLHIASQTEAEEVPAVSKTMGAALIVVSANGQGANPGPILEAADIPVMLVPRR